MNQIRNLRTLRRLAKQVHACDDVYAKVLAVNEFLSYLDYYPWNECLGLGLFTSTDIPKTPERKNFDEFHKDFQQKINLRITKFGQKLTETEIEAEKVFRILIYFFPRNSDRHFLRLLAFVKNGLARPGSPSTCGYLTFLSKDLKNFVRTFAARMPVELSHSIIDRAVKKIVARVARFETVKASGQQTKVGRPSKEAIGPCELMNLKGMKQKELPAHKQGKGKHVNEQMLGMLQKRPESANWSARQWAEVLDCSKSTIAETTTWKENLHMAKIVERTDRGVRQERKAGRSDDD